MQTPDLTRAQLLAVAKAVIAVVVAFGVPLHPDQQIALLTLAGTLAVVLIGADAAIRRARAQHLAGPKADQAAAEAIATATTAAKEQRRRAAIASEAKLEAQAQAANEPPPTADDGNDPAVPV